MSRRFTIDQFDLLDNGEPTTVEEVCELLNNLYEENKRLVKVNQELNDTLQDYNDEKALEDKELYCPSKRSMRYI